MAKQSDTQEETRARFQLFVEQLAQIVADPDPARRAALRRNAGIPMEEARSNALAAFFGLAHDSGLDKRYLKVAWLVAGLYASHPPLRTDTDANAQGSSQESTRSFAQALRLLAVRSQGGDRKTVEGTPIEHRLQRLLDSDRDQLGPQLRGLIAQLGHEGISFDWVEFAVDLYFWGPWTKLRWAEKFWYQKT
jgi:CRISPR type I-E-associated protein CasB/Cse2